MPRPNLTDDRLAWLAIRDQLRKRSRRGFGQLLLRLGDAFPSPPSVASIAGRVSTPTSGNQLRDRRMARYAIAADELVGHLSVEDRATLREHGTVPDWFLPRVLERAKHIRW